MKQEPKTVRDHQLSENGHHQFSGLAALASTMVAALAAGVCAGAARAA
jgi:hypothetical protein